MNVSFWKGFSVGVFASIITLIALVIYGIHISAGEDALRAPNLTQNIEKESLQKLEIVNVTTNTVSKFPANKLVFLNVWQTWCGPCHREMPSIEKLKKIFDNDSRIEFVILSDEPIEKIRNEIKKKKYNLPFFAVSSKLPIQFQDESIPRTYLIYGEKILFEEVGAVKWDDKEFIAFVKKNLDLHIPLRSRL